MGRQKYFTEEERKAAKKERDKRWREKNADKERERHKRYRQDNPEKVKDSQKRWREENPDYYKHYRQENLEKEKERYKRYRQENPEKERERHRKYRNTPMGRAINLVSRYQQLDKNANRGECTLTAQWVMDNIFNKPCHYCGKEGWNVVGCDRIDNDLPHTEDNVVPCCYECNVKRNIMNYEEFKQITIP